MANEATKKQFKDFFEAAIEKQKNPDPRERLKKIRRSKAEKVSQKYGF